MFSNRHGTDSWQRAPHPPRETEGRTSVGAAPVLAATFVPALRPYLLVGAVASVVVLTGASVVAYHLSVSRYAAAEMR